MLRIRTGYSFRAAVGSLQSVMDRIKQCELPFAPITDRNSTFGWVKWEKLCEKNNIKPLFGVEIGVSPSIQAKKPVVDYWTFFAENDLSIVNCLLTLATSQFRYEPLLSYDQACSFNGIIIVGNRAQLKEIQYNANLYIGLSPSCSKGYIRDAGELGHRFVAVSDNKYPDIIDCILYEVVCGRNADIQTYDQFIQPIQLWKNSVDGLTTSENIELAITNSNLIGNKINAKLRKATLLIPEKKQSLGEMCREAAPRKKIDLTNKVYSDRLERELNMIEEKKFEDYFYIISDMMKFARERMICGPARGSSCGSLVCYLLDITTVDPIPFGLIFERFIDINRADLPDIDLDFSDTKRDIVFQYAEQKYGREHVARLGTVALYRPRSALDEAGTAIRAPKWEIDKVIDSLIVRSSGDARALSTLEDTLNSTDSGKKLLTNWPEIKIAAKMEGHPRHSGQHAAGIVITETPVTDYVAVDSRTGATFCDKYDAETLNLLKIDALGLTQLSIFEDALEYAGLPMDYLESVPMDDPAAFDVLNKGQYSGVFQFMGVALQNVAKAVKITELNDIVMITALARPGPLVGGGTNEWIKRKNGKAIVYPHILLEPYMRDTLGVITYQEQILEIGRNIGDLSWEDVTQLRKSMSKSLGKEYFDKYGDRFKIGARAKGISDDILNKLWDELCSYGSWAFNKSHSVAYGIISYWCCYLKAHFPFEYAAASLSHEGDSKKQIMMLREMHREGIGYIPVDFELSTNKWRPAERDGQRVLVGPLSIVKGIGPKVMAQILSHRKGENNKPLPPKVFKMIENPQTEIDSLWPIRDKFKQVMPNPQDRNILTPPTEIIDVQTNGREFPTLVFCVIKQIKPRDENEEVLVAKRKGEIKKGQTAYLNMFLNDDTDEIYAKIDTRLFRELAQPIIDRGSPGKHLYAIKGKVPRNFRMITVENVRYIGEI